MNADGSNVVLLELEEASRPRFSPSWSPDGTQIAFQSPLAPRNTKIFIYDLVTGTETQLEGLEGNNQMPTWSPDGTQIAFIAGNSLYITDIDGGDPTRIVSADSNPDWSPDGTLIAYGWDNDVYVVNIDGTDARAITSRYDSGQPAWSPDGTQIAFAQFDFVRDQRDIAVINIDSTGYEVLLERETDDYAPTWSPDGEWIAFTSDRSNNLEIFIMGADGTGLTNVSNNSATDRAPHWSPIIE